MKLYSTANQILEIDAGPETLKPCDLRLDASRAFAMSTTQVQASRNLYMIRGMLSLSTTMHILVLQ
jgi:hypothetical protein